MGLLYSYVFMVFTDVGTEATLPVIVLVLVLTIAINRVGVDKYHMLFLPLVF